MDGSLFRWVTSTKLVVFFAIFLTSYLICMAFAQDDSQNQAAVEQALRDALPKDEDLPGGIAWNPSNYRPEFLDISWNGHRISQECYHGSNINTEVDNFYVSGSITQCYYESAKDFRSKHISISSQGVAPRPYEKLPGGVIWEYKSDQHFDFEISFWKSPNISGNVRFNVVLGTNCGRPTPERQAEAEAFVLSECERMARLVYDQLPGGDPKYNELILVLKKYRPIWFGLALNPNLSEDIISQALSEHEVGEGGMEGATVALNRDMLSRIDQFWEMQSEPIPSWNKPLITNLEKDDWDKTMDKYHSVLNSAYRYIELCDDYGYEYDFPVPPPLGPAEWILKYKEFQDKAEYLRDSYYLPAISEDMYQRYKDKRLKLGSNEAFEESIFETQTTWDWIKGSGWYAVRAAPEFSFMQDDNAAVERLLLQRFENRYNIEKLRDERDKMAKYSDYYISAIIHEYDNKILHISKTCDTILDDQNTTNQNHQ